MAAGLAYDVLVSGLTPVADAPPPNGEAPNWSPLSHTLIYGPTTALLVDPPITAAQTDALGDWIETHGRALEHIYVTHWHGDHWLGAARLLRRFPEATVFASAATKARIEGAVAGGRIGSPWPELFGDRLDPDAAEVVVEVVPAAGIEVDGETVHAIEAGHSDTDDSTILHVPSLALVVAGDVVYDNVHQYLAEVGDEGLDGWRKGLDLVTSLKPRNVVAGHKDARRPDSPATIEETRDYLDVVGALLEARPSAEEFFARVRGLYPDRVNPYTAWLTAKRVLGTTAPAASPTGGKAR